MTSSALDIVPLWAVALLIFASAILAFEAGSFLGQWRRRHFRDEKDAPVGAIVGSILGLIGIMLAFAFSLAASRFDARRQAVLDEANALGTTFLRARLLPEPQASKVSELLREYVDLRITGVLSPHLAERISESERIHQELWSLGIEAAESDAGAIKISLFLQSLNSVIDLHSSRVFAGMYSRMPMVIWTTLFGLVVAGMGSIGYQYGHTATRRSPVEWLLALTFASVLYLIVDLDRAQQGTLRVSQQPLIDLRKSMDSAPR